MALLQIITAPDSRLREVSQPVDAVDDTVRNLLDDMLETMYAAPGIGLSAIQVGFAQRIVVIDTAKGLDPADPVRMINPEIIWQADEVGPFEEGCLSFPDQYEEVERPDAVHVRYTDENGEIRTIKAEGLQAIALQHELDHLDGVLLVDHLSNIKRSIIMRRMKKLRRLQAAE
jgi:peptide deformylase